MWSNKKKATILWQAYGYIIVSKYYSEKYSDSLSIKIKPQKCGGEIQLSMEVIDLEYLNN